MQIIDISFLDSLSCGHIGEGRFIMFQVRKLMSAELALADSTGFAGPGTNVSISELQVF